MNKILEDIDVLPELTPESQKMVDELVNASVKSESYTKEELMGIRDALDKVTVPGVSVHALAALQDKTDRMIMQIKNN